MKSQSQEANSQEIYEQKERRFSLGVIGTCGNWRVEIDQVPIYRTGSASKAGGVAHFLKNVKMKHVVYAALLLAHSQVRDLDEDSLHIFDELFERGCQESRNRHKRWTEETS